MLKIKEKIIDAQFELILINPSLLLKGEVIA
jgi:hypothetical protein